LAQAYMAAGFGRSAQAATIGDESRYFSASLGSGEQGRGYPTAVLLAVDGNVVIELYLVDLVSTSKFPFLREADEVLNPIGEAITARLQAARNGEAPGLGLMVPRVSGSGSVYRQTRYEALDGNVVGESTPSGEPVEALQAFLDRDGVIDGFISDVGIPQGEGTIWVVSEVLSFGSVAQASHYLGEREDQMAQQPGAWVEVVPPAVGEESVMVRWTKELADGSTAHRVMGVVRVGAMTSEVTVRSAEEVSDSDLVMLMEMAVGCLMGGGCVEGREVVFSDQ